MWPPNPCCSLTSHWPQPPWGSSPAGSRGTKFYFVDGKVSPLSGCQVSGMGGRQCTRPAQKPTKHRVTSEPSHPSNACRLQLLASSSSTHFCVAFCRALRPRSTSGHTDCSPASVLVCCTAVDLKKAAARPNLSLPSPPFPAPHSSHTPVARLDSTESPAMSLNLEKQLTFVSLTFPPNMVTPCTIQPTEYKNTAADVDP